LNLVLGDYSYTLRKSRAPRGSCASTEAGIVGRTGRWAVRQTDSRLMSTVEVGSLNLINARRPTSHAFPDGYGGSHQRLAPPPRMWEKSGPGPLSWVEVAIETPATTNAFLDDLKASLATWRKVPLLPIVTTSERGD
jgi:hypothetical protein